MTNIGIHPLDNLNKEARKLLKRLRADAVLLITVGADERLEFAAAGHKALPVAMVVHALRAAADSMERESSAH